MYVKDSFLQNVFQMRGGKCFAQVKLLLEIAIMLSSHTYNYYYILKGQSFLLSPSKNVAINHHKVKFWVTLEKGERRDKPVFTHTPAH